MDILFFTFLYPSGAVATSRPRISNSLLLASQTSTPRLTPPGSPPISSASVSPTRTSKPVSPKRHSMSFSVSRGMFDRTSMYSSAGNHSSVSSPHGGTHTGLFLKLSPLEGPFGILLLVHSKISLGVGVCIWFAKCEFGKRKRKRKTLVSYTAMLTGECFSVFFYFLIFLI